MDSCLNLCVDLSVCLCMRGFSQSNIVLPDIAKMRIWGKTNSDMATGVVNEQMWLVVRPHVLCDWLATIQRCTIAVSSSHHKSAGKCLSSPAILYKIICWKRMDGVWCGRTSPDNIPIKHNELWHGLGASASYTPSPSSQRLFCCCTALHLDQVFQGNMRSLTKRSVTPLLTEQSALLLERQDLKLSLCSMTTHSNMHFYVTWKKKNMIRPMYTQLS